MRNKYRNPAEQQCYEELISQGWDVTKRGWPDFICYKNGNLALVEVKPYKSIHLKVSQYRLMAALARLGVKCFRWTPQMGVQPITPLELDISKRQLKKLQCVPPPRGE